MKLLKILCLLLPLAFPFKSLMAQSAADKILGYYLTLDDDTKKEKSQVQIYKNSNGKYYGKIVWLKEPNENGKPKLDKHNPDEKLQKRAIMGLEMLKDFTYNKGDQEWSDGMIS